MSDLSDFMPQKLDAVKGIPITITDFRMIQGEKYQYAIIYAQDQNGKIITLRTTGTTILSALQQVKDAGKLPINATFEKDGRVWVAQ